MWGAELRRHFFVCWSFDDSTDQTSGTRVVDPEATAAHLSAAPPGRITQLFWRCYGNFQHNTTVSVYHTQTHTHWVVSPTSTNQSWKEQIMRTSIFKYLFLSLMYLQALNLLCRSGVLQACLVSCSANLAICFLKLHFCSFFVWMYVVCSSAFVFDSSVDWPASLHECIPRPLVRCMYISTQNGPRLCGYQEDDLWPPGRHTRTTVTVPVHPFDFHLCFPFVPK